MGVGNITSSMMASILALGPQEKKKPKLSLEEASALNPNRFDGVVFNRGRLVPDKQALDQIPKELPNKKLFTQMAERIADYFNQITVDNIDKDKIHYQPPAEPPTTGLGSTGNPYTPKAEDFEPVFLAKDAMASILGIKEEDLPSISITAAQHFELLTKVLGNEQGQDERFRKALGEFNILDTDKYASKLKDPKVLNALKQVVMYGDTKTENLIKDDGVIEGKDKDGNIHPRFVPAGDINIAGMPESFFPEVKDKGKGVKLLPQVGDNPFQKVHYISPFTGADCIGIRSLYAENTKDGNEVNVRITHQNTSRIAAFPTQYDVNLLSGRRFNPKHREAYLGETKPEAKPEEVNE